MNAQYIYDSKDDIPEAIRDLYTEQSDGKFKMTNVSGIPDAGDRDYVKGLLDKEREEHKATKEKLRPWDGLDPTDVRKDLARIPELEIAAKGTKEEMDAKLDELTEARIQTRLSPLEHELKEAKAKLAETESELTGLQTQSITREKHDILREEGVKAKMNSDILPDFLDRFGGICELTDEGKLITGENNLGIPQGLSPDVLVSKLKELRPSYWSAAVGGDSTGSSVIPGMTDNPFTKKNWNMTKQGQIVREHGIEKAEQMAKAAGTTVGGPEPKE